MVEAAEVLKKDYTTWDAPTLTRFHDSAALNRCIVGPVGSGKTSAAAAEVCSYIPWELLKEYGIKNTRWAVVRNTYVELIDTTQRTVFEWFNWGHYNKSEKVYTLSYPNGPEVEILFRSCDSPDDIKKFKSLELTGAWIDESIEIADEIKLMLKGRIGRFPKLETWMQAIRKNCKDLRHLSDEEIKALMEDQPERFLNRFFIETTNPPDIEHPTYSQYKWIEPPPGPIPTEQPLKNHVGFWQKPGENERHLRPGYYRDLKTDYANNPDWIATYIEGKPGIIIHGKLVYQNFERAYHVAKEPLVWPGPHCELWRGWDHSGNTPACIVIQMPTMHRIHVLKEFVTERLGIVDFAKLVNTTCNQLFPGAAYHDWGDPAGAAEFSKKEGGFTSNTNLIQEAIGIDIQTSEQNWMARQQSVEQQLLVRDGMLIDPGCIRLINGFIGGYCHEEILHTGIYKDEPIKNKFSHIHEALQYVLLKLTGRKVNIKPLRSKHRRRDGRVV